MDLFSRHILSWKLSNSFDIEFCLDALEMALSGGHKPETFHSDQGCQFISTAFVGRLKAEEIEINWSGRRRCYYNILIEKNGARSNKRRCSCMPIAMVGKPRHTSHSSFGGIVM